MVGGRNEVDDNDGPMISLPAIVVAVVIVVLVIYLLWCL